MTHPTPSGPNQNTPTPAAQELQRSLAAALADTPYAVGGDPRHPGTITVAWKAVDQKWNTILRRQSLSIDQGLRVILNEADRTYRLDDIVVDRAFYAGVDLSGFHLRDVKSVQRGRIIRHEAHKSVQWGIVKSPEGGLAVETSDFGTYRFSTETMRKAVIDALTSAGWAKRGLSMSTKLGIVGACVGGLAAVLGGLVAVFAAVSALS